MASEQGTAFARLRAVAPALSVSVLAANLSAVGDDVRRLEQAGLPLLHFDVMDGVFTPMLTMGPPFVRAIRTPMLKDVHLMIREPLATIGDYVAAGADIITVHVEASVHVHRALQHLGTLKNANDPARGIVRGVALNPGTPLETIAPLLDEVDLVVLLAINPGWGGQSFLRSTFSRIERARQMISATGRDILVAVDGGITRKNIGDLAGAGVDIVVTGSALFDGNEPAANAAGMMSALSGKSAPGPEQV